MTAAASAPASDHAVENDDDETWPTELRSELHGRLPALRSYHQERLRLQDDPRYKYTPKPNQWGDVYNDTIALVGEVIKERRIVGYHATRLMPDEITTILRHGMRTTSAALAQTRVQTRVEAGDISEEFARLLLSKSCAEHTGQGAEYGRRKGMIWLCFAKSLLADESGIWRLFSLWGGEMIYWAHGENSVAADALAKLGTACIVEAEVPSSEIKTYCSVGERLLRSFLHRNDVPTEHDASWEGHIEIPIPAVHIRRIVSRASPDFALLTGCDDWQSPLT